MKEWIKYYFSQHLLEEENELYSKRNYFSKLYIVLKILKLFHSTVLYFLCKLKFLVLCHYIGRLYLIPTGYQNFVRMKTFYHNCNFPASWSILHDVPLPVSTSVCLYKPLNLELNAQSWTSPQSSIESLDRIYPAVFGDSLIRFSDKLHRNSSSGKSVLTNFLTQIYILVLIKKVTLTFAHDSPLKEA